MLLKSLMQRLAVLALCLFSALAQAEEPITVFAAASMRDALEAASAEYETAVGSRPVFSFAASSVLARQIEAGAPVDIFISADEEWMDWAAERGLIVRETRRVIAGNELVIAAPNATAPVENPARLLAARFAMGDPAHVPAGRYAQTALKTLGLWEMVRANAVFGENVRVALELVRRGEVAAAIVYASDHQAAPELSVAFIFPGETHPPIVYPAALVAGGNEQATALLDFLSGEAGQRIFAAHGFSALLP